MRALLITPLMLASPTALLAQDAPPPAPEVTPASEAKRSDIVVIATRLAGQVDTEIPPVLTLDEADISAYGAGSITELLDAVSTQTGSGRGRGGGRPVILLNGQRVSSFREMRSIPSEAIRRMEVLPEEVALKFGYAANQRVVNFILKENFSSIQVAGEYNAPTRGGYVNTELEGGLLRIDGPRRLNLEAKLVDTTLLTETERSIVQEASELAQVPVGVDPGLYRSLAPAGREITLNGTWSMGLGTDGMNGSLSANSAFTRTDTRSLQGLDDLLLTGAARELRALRRKVGTDSFEGGLGFNKPLGSWLLTLTGEGSFSDSTTSSDLPGGVAAGRDLAREKNLSFASLATLAGRPFALPAGEAGLTVKAGFDYDCSDSSDAADAIGTVLDRRGLSAGLNLSLPLTSRKDNVLGEIGDLSVNASAGIEDLSDFGTLTDWSAGLTWKPTGKLTLQASYLVSQAAPTLTQLGAPQIVTLNVPVYDFVRGEAATIAVTTGGNPDLLAEKQRDWKLSANWELPVLAGSNLLVEYFRNSSSDVTQSFPLLTGAVEAAFPARVTRDATGRLMTIDRRPVTFDNVESSRLRWGFNLSGRLGKQEGGREGGPASSDRRGPFGGGGPPPGMMRFMGGGQQGGRWNLSVYHTWRFSDRVTIASGGPVLDQLGGDALSAGGVPRHAVSFEGGAFKNGFGLRLNGTWTAPATVLGSGAPGTSDLRFGSTFDIYARLFINLDERKALIDKAPWLKGTRIAFEFENLFDSRQKVTDEAGLIPLAYQRAYRDPQGRVIGIDIRKLF